MRNCILTVCLIASTMANAEEQRKVVGNIQPLLFEALNRFDGKAKGVLGGSHARFLAKGFNITQPLLVDVSTVLRYRESGCSRLLVDFKQKNVLMPKAKERKDVEYWMQINYCKNGQPPAKLDPA